MRSIIIYCSVQMDFFSSPTNMQLCYIFHFQLLGVFNLSKTSFWGFIDRVQAKQLRVVCTCYTHFSSSLVCIQTLLFWLETVFIISPSCLSSEGVYEKSWETVRRSCFFLDILGLALLSLCVSVYLCLFMFSLFNCCQANSCLACFLSLS